MPFYEYQCSACGAQVEILQKITDAPLKKCPECGRSKLAKLVSAPVFRLKGGGWYETDFKSDKEARRNLVESEKAETAASDKPAEKADGKTEAKSEAKPESKAEPKPKPDAKPVARRSTAKAKKPVAKRRSR